MSEDIDLVIDNLLNNINEKCFNRYAGKLEVEKLSDGNIELCYSIGHCLYTVDRNDAAKIIFLLNYILKSLEKGDHLSWVFVDSK